MYERILKLQYVGKVVNLAIPDIDKCLLTDVLNDMSDEYEKRGFELPQFPLLQYRYGEESQILTDDTTMMTMFEVVKTKEIDIWVVPLLEPNLIWTLAQQVKGEAVRNPRKVDKLPVRRPNQPTQIDAHTLSPPQSPLHVQSYNIASQSSVATTIATQLTPIFTDASKISQRSANTLLRPTPFPHGKKMPRSTAVWKGIFTPKQAETFPEMQATGHNERPEKRNVASLKAIDVDEEETTEGNDSDSEKEYHTMSGDESEEVVNMELDEENIQDLLNQNFADGDWEPFQTNEWCPEDCGYLKKMYKNGEVFDGAKIGRIRLKEWQLFVDKEHFKDTLRDFCIQEGFALVVERADSFRYSAICAEQRCQWKIHVSLLPDKGGNTAREVAEQQEKTTKAQKLTTKQSKKKRQGIEDTDFSLIELLVVGFIDQYVETNDNTTSNSILSYNSGGRDQASTSTAEGTNLIDNMISHSHLV